jgi:drug/metabolite transporter (DMT)-like permease
MTRRERRATAAVGWCLISAALFGASTPIAKALLDDLGPITLAGLLYLGAAIGVAPFSRRGGSPERRRSRTHLGYLLAAILFGGIVGPVLLLWGLTLTPAASASLWLNLETVATAGLAWLLFREHVGVRTAIAAGCVVAAGVLLAAPFDTGTLAGAGLIAAACVCWGIDNNVTALLDGYTPAQATLIKGAVAGALNLSIGIATEGVPGDGAIITAAVTVGAIAYGVSIMLYISGAQRLGATRSQLLFATAPFWGMVLAWVGFGESATTMQLLALVPMAGGVALLLGGTHEHDHTHAPLTHAHSHRHDDGHHDHVHPNLPAWLRHTHEHRHAPMTHRHAHHPDLHHRHAHD